MLAATQAEGVGLVPETESFLLAANAGRFGFFQPSSVAPGGANEEAWHWETET